MLIWALVAVRSAAADLAATVDLTAATVPFVHNWKKCVGSGHMLLGTRADWREHLKLARDELGFVGVRGHGLLDDDMSVVPNRDISPNKTMPYEFYNVDQVFEYLVELGIKPVVELSFMPKALAACGGPAPQPPCSYAFSDSGGYKGLRMPPDDPEQWYDLVAALCAHLVERFGLAEVASWHFEVWNELWGIPFPPPEQRWDPAMYMSLYNASARAVKSVHKSLRVGGPATMQVHNVSGFIDACRAGGVPVDFVSTHFYPTDPACETNETKGDIDCFGDQVLGAQALAAEAKLPFFITEYNNGLGKTSRDDASAAAFAFRQMGKMQALDMFSWWTFSDVFEENWMRSAPFHNGYGMMTVQGTRKPVWRAFQALAGAGTKRHAVEAGSTAGSTVSVLATDGGGGALDAQLFVANWHRVDAQRYSCDAKQGTCVEDSAGSFSDEALCDQNCRATPGGRAAAASLSSLLDGGLSSVAPWLRDARNVTIAVTHAALPAAALPTTVTAFRIDAAHANPQALWDSWGSPQYVTKAQVASLDAASQVVPEVLPLARVSDTESTVTLLMPEYSTVHLVM